VSATLAQHSSAALLPDPARVVAKLFLPGEEPPQERSRVGRVVERVLALPVDEVERLTRGLLTDFAPRHRHYRQLLEQHASIVISHIPEGVELTPAHNLLVGASFTAEYSVEAAALCNPSAVPHPDQSGLQPGQARLALSLRGIGEGHISSIGFSSAIVGPGARWEFERRQMPVVAGVSTEALWHREHLRAVLADELQIAELAHSVVATLPEEFTGTDLQVALFEANQDLMGRPGGQDTVDLLRRLVTSAYEVEFESDVELSQRVLLPSAPEESNGMEDARFVRFVGEDGTVEYRATYTAYDGRQIAPRLLTSPDLRVFRAHRLAGPAARNKGMALFPRLIKGKHWSLCRTDGESNFLASSENGYRWGHPERVQVPQASWEVLQIGNCGPPIETDAGWLVLTHGVGPMRTYAIGAILLDLDTPSKVIGQLKSPLVQARPNEREGYVPNVVYSCGGVVHDGLLWIPYGIGDAKIGVAWVQVEQLLAAMTPLR
jgi:predicted GH43/DUF377 family glycosyl hydrolase